MSLFCHTDKTSDVPITPTHFFKTFFSPCYEENDPQRLPGDSKQEQRDGWAEGDESASEKHSRRHFGSSGRDAGVLVLLKSNLQLFDAFSPKCSLFLKRYSSTRGSWRLSDVTCSHVTWGGGGCQKTLLKTKQ